MPLDLHHYETLTKQAVRTFWQSRTMANKSQKKRGVRDQGQRSSVTAGKNMNGFIKLISAIVQRNGMPDADIHTTRRVLTLPGYFRPTKVWDVLVMHKGILIAALELKSHVGPSFGNNFNNRAEEAIGAGHDFWTAYREGSFGNSLKPFLGWLMLVEDCEKSHRPVSVRSPHFDVFPEYNDASYLIRYDILSTKMIRERLYSSACLITSPKTGISSGQYGDMSSTTSVRVFMAQLAGHIASAQAAL